MSGVTSAANSKSVAQGGAMFSTSRVTVSKETQEMLKGQPVCYTARHIAS